MNCLNYVGSRSCGVASSAESEPFSLLVSSKIYNIHTWGTPIYKKTVQRICTDLERGLHWSVGVRTHPFSPWRPQWVDRYLKQFTQWRRQPKKVRWSEQFSSMTSRTKLQNTLYGTPYIYKNTFQQICANLRRDLNRSWGLDPHLLPWWRYSPCQAPKSDRVPPSAGYDVRCIRCTIVL